MRVTGSLRDKHGIYQMVVRVQSDDESPIQKSRSTQIRTAGKNQKETRANKLSAERMLASWMAELEQRYAEGKDRLFISAIEEWLKKKKRDVRLNTYEAYALYYENHIKPFFEPKCLALREVTPRLIQKYADKKEEEGLSANSIQKHLVILNGVFKEAVKLQEVSLNPCSTVTLTRGERFRGKAYDAKTARSLMEAIKGDPIETPVLLGLYLGLRRSEVAGLRWSDIDFEENSVTVQNTVVRMMSLCEHEQTKTRASRRKLLIPSGLRTYLLWLKTQTEFHRKLFGDKYTDGTHVCQWQDGRPYRPDYITHRFRQLLEERGLPIIRFHDLRHTAGSLLINEGQSAKHVQELLGHERVSTTLDTYTHLSLEGKLDTASAMDAILTPGNDKHNSNTKSA